MPFFQDDLEGRRPLPHRPASIATPRTPEPETSRLSEESIRTDLCEGLLLEDVGIHGSTNSHIPSTPGLPSTDVYNRAELIERLKRGVSPVWVSRRSVSQEFGDIQLPSGDAPRTRYQLAAANAVPPPLQGAESRDASTADAIDRRDPGSAGLEIERPRSALHSGDFTQDTSRTFFSQDDVDSSTLFNSTPPSWFATSPPRDFSPFQREAHFQTPNKTSLDTRSRSRAPSLSSSLSSSFAFRAPTSPLVHSESHDEVGFASVDNCAATRRHPRRSMPLPSSSPYSASSLSAHADYGKPCHSLKRDNAYPYQAHQPRRSLTLSQGPAFAEQLTSTPSGARSRKPSISDSSPLQLTSMVGSYEESILRGRMSTAPSKPLDFVAQIGVLGLGQCKASLRCPPHVTVPFPAVFYSYASTPYGRSTKSEDGPSPYVGQIDLEGNLPHAKPADEVRRKRLPVVERNDDENMLDSSTPSNVYQREVRHARKQKRRSTSPKAPPGGSYRIPEKGQLQIIIKNPNKTAVKLFLVPYDLVGMEPGTKTFIRQRSYSTGPAMDIPATPSHFVPASDDRPTLRYLVHLHICSPSKGRFYLYKGIRVVFANRVPDGKEKLRNEIQLPEPRFSVYKPGRELNGGLSNNAGAGASLAAEKAYRRRSSGSLLGSILRHGDEVEVTTPESAVPFNNFSTTPIEPIPFSLYAESKRPKSNDNSSISTSRPPTAQDSGMGMSWTSGSSSSGGMYDKLTKGDAGYGGNAFTQASSGQKPPAEGLLALKLKRLGVSKISELGQEPDRFD